MENAVRSIVVDAFPASVEVSGSPAVIGRLADLLPLTSRDAADRIQIDDSEHSQFHVRWDEEDHLVADVDGAVSEVLSRLNYCHIEQSPSVLHLHAGAVVGDGYTVVLSGASGAGKSTLVAALCERQHAYLTDECVDLDIEGRVCAWRKPISLREGGRQLLADNRLRGSRFARLAQAETPPDRTVIVIVDPSAPQEATVMSRSDALHRLVDQSLDFGRRPGDLLWLGQFVAASSSYSLGRGPLDRMSQSIVMMGRAAEARGWCSEVDLHRIKPGTGGLQWSEQTEAIRLDDSLVVFNRSSKKIVSLAGSTDEFVEQLRLGSSAAELNERGIESILLETLVTHGLIEGG